MDNFKTKKFVCDNQQLLNEWDFSKNINYSPYKLTLGSGKKVWWMCEKGHEWDDTILHRSQGRNCPFCSNHRILLGYNNLFVTNPELEKEWDFNKNIINPNSISSGSHRKVWWICNNGHSFQSEIRERSKGSGCPICKNKLIVAGYNDIKTTHPALLQEWNYEKNIILPHEIGFGSHKKIWWKCKNGHEWLTTISKRIKGNGCPFCSNKKIKVGFNDLATKNPTLASEWNYVRNDNLTPNDVAPASSKKVWWKCKKGHEWKSTILSRHQGHNCPICANQKILIGYNDLATTHPILSQEWHPTKNGNLTPKNVIAGSNKKVWWIGKCGHEWQTSISNRSSGNNCPICAKGNQISFPEKCMYFYIKQLFPDAEENVRLDKLNKTELDIFIPSISVGVEYDGSHWHDDLLKDIQKNEACKKNGITLYRIRENGCPYYKSNTWLYLTNNGLESLENGIKHLIRKLSNNKTIDINIKRDQLLIYELMSLSTKERSIEKLNPQLAKEWHPTKNGKLKPSQFTVFSAKKVWWIGKCGHEWNAAIQSRTSGSNCPICSNNMILKGFNDLATTNPDLLKEWNYDKNKVSPSEIFAGSEILVWWKCENGHEWQTYPYKRKAGENCPICTNRKIVVGINDFATVNPHLLIEWDYDKNEQISPTEISSGSNKIVWWKCKKCGHEWQTSVSARSKGHGCKKCANSELGEKLSVLRLKTNGSLYDKYPELMNEWNYDKNKEITPQSITAHSKIKVWWKCKECGYEWQSAVNNRTNNHGCPKCSQIKVQQSKRLTELNLRGSLLQNKPELALEWDYDKNDKLPSDVFLNSTKKVWWICSKGHNYHTSPNNRNRGRNCPYCSNKKVLKGFNDFATLKPNLLKEWNWEKNINISPHEVTPGSDKKVWWICSKCGTEWETKIGNRSRGNNCPKCRTKTKEIENE